MWERGRGARPGIEETGKVEGRGERGLVWQRSVERRRE